MACFLAPMAEAIVTTAVTRAMRKKESDAGQAHDTQSAVLPFSRKLKWLSNLLWGGSALLAFEHLWHGEISPVFPFLTAMKSPCRHRRHAPGAGHRGCGHGRPDHRRLAGYGGRLPPAGAAERCHCR